MQNVVTILESSLAISYGFLLILGLPYDPGFTVTGISPKVFKSYIQVPSYT